MPKLNLWINQISAVKELFEKSSEEIHELAEFFIDTACEAARDTGNPMDAMVARYFALVFSPSQSEAVEGKLAGKIVTR